MGEEKIGVSVICNAFNQEKYIKETLEGFLMQKTNFEYEILIHDDASNDNTAQVIREYEKKYPKIIKAIYEEENQYSKSTDISRTFQYPRAAGKYVALCEGDDYWIDPYKLQKQYDALEQNKDIDICAHGVYVLNDKTGKMNEKITPSPKNKVFTLNEVIQGGGGFVATNSLMLRTDILKNEPKFVKYYGIDYAIQIYGSVRGGMIYLSDIMGVYRAAASGSWSVRMANDKNYRDEQEMKLQTMLHYVDEYTAYKYTNLIQGVILNAKYNNLANAKEYRRLMSSEFREIFKKKPLKHKLKVVIYSIINSMMC